MAMQISEVTRDQSCVRIRFKIVACRYSIYNGVTSNLSDRFIRYTQIAFIWGKLLRVIF